VAFQIRERFVVNEQGEAQLRARLANQELLARAPEARRRVRRLSIAGVAFEDAVPLLLVDHKRIDLEAGAHPVKRFEPALHA
jgi:hypothetical protein